MLHLHKFSIRRIDRLKNTSWQANMWQIKQSNIPFPSQTCPPTMHKLLTTCSNQHFLEDASPQAFNSEDWQIKEYILTSKHVANKAIKHSLSFTNMPTHYAQAAHNMLKSALLRGCCISTSHAKNSEDWQIKEYILTSKYVAVQAIKHIKHSRSFTYHTYQYILKWHVIFHLFFHHNGIWIFLGQFWHWVVGSE